MTDSAVLELREEYESSGLKLVQFADHKGMELEKTRYALRKALKLRRHASGEISFTPIKPSRSIPSQRIDSLQYIIIETSNGTVVQIPS